MTTFLIMGACAAAGLLLGKLWTAVAARLTAKKKTPGKKPMGVMDKALLLEAIVLITYTAVVLVMFYATDNGEPSTLTTCVFAVWSFENGIMGWIKTTKDKAPARSAAPEAPVEAVEPPDAGTKEV